MTKAQEGLFADAQTEGPEAARVRRSERTSTRFARAQGGNDDEGVKTQGPERRAAPQPSGASAGRGAALSVRLSAPMLEAVEKAVEQSPIEFSNVSDFVRRAVETELRRRGLVKTFRD